MRFRKQKQISGHSAGIYSLAYDGEYIYSASADKYVARWNVKDGTQDKFAIRFETAVYTICLINDAQHLVVGLADGGIHIFDLANRQELKFYTQHKKAVFEIKENPVKHHFYVTDADGNLSIWNAVDFSLLLYLPLDSGKIRRIAVQDNGELIALACQDETVRIIETEFFNEIELLRAHEGGTTAVMFHPIHSELLLSGGKDALLKCWNWKEKKLISAIPAHNFAIYDLIAINNGENFISISRDKTIKIWNSETLSFLQRLDTKSGGHSHSINSIICLTEDSFATASDDRRIIFWEEDINQEF